MADTPTSNGFIHDVDGINVPNGYSTLPNFCYIYDWDFKEVSNLIPTTFLDKFSQRPPTYPFLNMYTYFRPELNAM